MNNKILNKLGENVSVESICICDSTDQFYNRNIVSMTLEGILHKCIGSWQSGSYAYFSKKPSGK